MFVLTRWSVRTIAATAVIGLASSLSTVHAQPRPPVPPVVHPPVVHPLPRVNPVPNPIVIPPGPKVPVAGIPHPPAVNPNVVRVMPQINSFPGFPTYPTVNPFTPSLSDPFGTPFTTFRPVNPFANPFNNPLNPFNNPLINNNPFINNNPLINNNPFLVNPLLNNPFNNPFAVNPLLQNPFALPAIGFNPGFNGVSPYMPGTLVYKGPNTFVNNSTGAVVQPITGTTFADGTTFYRAPSIGITPPAYGYLRPTYNGVFTPYIW